MQLWFFIVPTHCVIFAATANAMQTVLHRQQSDIQMTEKSTYWSREQLLIAFNLYCQMPFGKMHSKNPDIIRFADLIGRTPSALAMKLTNIASLGRVLNYI